MTEYVIEAKGLSRDYGRFRALDKADLSIEANRVVALLGPNGAGKTTLLHLLMGMLEPTEGRAYVLGADSRADGCQALSNVSYVGHGEEPPSWMTARQLVDLQEGASKYFDRALALKLLADKQLSGRTSFGSMSKGQKKWLRAALALASRPRVLIWDEPAEGLDPAARHALYDCLREYVIESGATALIATHIIGDIERVADDVAIIRQGRIITHACLEDLREQVFEIHQREVALPAAIESHVAVIGKKVLDDGVLFWVRSRGLSEEELRGLLSPRADLRGVDLETFYMATTENGLRDERGVS
ncbi:MAG: ABC transporter ATP-binding protein [Anaerohalosphaeraceae bacterium]|jgi:ABC-2 type transport system ATP-binding protein